MLTSVHISFTFSKIMLQCLSKAFTRPSSFLLFRQLMSTCERLSAVSHGRLGSTRDCGCPAQPTVMHRVAGMCSSQQTPPRCTHQGSRLRRQCAARRGESLSPEWNGEGGRAVSGKHKASRRDGLCVEPVPENCSSRWWSTRTEAPSGRAPPPSSPAHRPWAASAPSFDTAAAAHPASL